MEDTSLQHGKLKSGALRVVTSTRNVLEVIKHGMKMVRDPSWATSAAKKPVNLDSLLNLRTFLPKMRDRRERGQTEVEWFILRKDDHGRPIYVPFELVDSCAEETRYILGLEIGLGYHEVSNRIQLTNPSPDNADRLLKKVTALLQHEKQRQFQILHDDNDDDEEEPPEVQAWSASTKKDVRQWEDMPVVVTPSDVIHGLRTHRC